MNWIHHQGGSILWKFLFLVFIVALSATIYFPWRQRKIEENQILQTRLHLVDIYMAERFFFEGRQYYTSDPDSLLSYINNVRSMRIDTVSTPIGVYYALGDSIRESELWQTVEPREPNAVPVKTVPSSRASLAGVCIFTVLIGQVKSAKDRR